MIEELWRGATKAQRLRAGAAAGLVVWAAALVADMHYLRARPDFGEKFPHAVAGEAPAVGLFGSKPRSSSAAGASGAARPLGVDDAERGEDEPEWRRARRERGESARLSDDGGGGGGGRTA